MDIKRANNLKQLSQTNDNTFPELLENIRSDIEYEKHCALGLGKRMPAPKNLSFEQAHKIKEAIYKRVVDLWGENQDMSTDPNNVLKVT